MDITNPSQPVETGYYNTPGSADGIAVLGAYALVADNAYFEIFDCSQAMSVPNHNITTTPVTFSLHPAYPNPFNPSTTLAFDLPVATRVTLSVYDILGCRMATLANGWHTAGTHQVTFNGSHLSSGIYFYELSARNYHAVRKAILLK
jgi:hypothetical protein